MGERYEAYKLASALDHNDLQYVQEALQLDAQRMDPNTFQFMLNDANQQRQNGYADHLAQDPSGLPIIDIVSPSNQLDLQVQVQGQQGYDQQQQGYDQPQPGYAPPPPPYYPQEQQPQGYYESPQQFQGQEQGYYAEPNPCGGRTALGAIGGALAGSVIAGGRSRGVGALLGALAGGTIANGTCQ
jgi:hypothetical protein